MLFQLPPRASQVTRFPSSEGCSSFEAGLRRDLATAPVVRCDPVLGGWRKRTLDLTITLVLLPVWLLAILLIALRLKLSHRMPILISDNRIGYGGRGFHRLFLRLDEPAYEGAADPAPPGTPANDVDAIGDDAEDRRAKWKRACERLPQLLNVLRGDMSLVGPEPLTADDIEQLKSGKRHYLSMRPGVFGIDGLVHDEQPERRFKAYALSWSVLTDLRVIWDGLRGLYNRGNGPVSA